MSGISCCKSVIYSVILLSLCCLNMRSIIRIITFKQDLTMKRFFLLVMLIISLCSCVDLGYVDIRIFNDSDIPIACFVADGVNSRFAYPDTLLQAKLDTFCLKENIPCYSSKLIYSGQGNYDMTLSRFLNIERLSIYVFSQSEVIDKGWDLIVKNNQYLVRYDLLADDLEMLNGEVHYPPTAEMSTMHMYPPYSDVVSAKK